MWLVHTSTSTATLLADSSVTGVTYRVYIWHTVAADYLLLRLPVQVFSLGGRHVTCMSYTLTVLLLLLLDFMMEIGPTRVIYI